SDRWHSSCFASRRFFRNSTPPERMPAVWNRWRTRWDCCWRQRASCRCDRNRPLVIAAAMGSPPLATGILARAVRGHLRRVAAHSPLTAGTRFRQDFPRRWSVWQKLTNDELATRLKQLVNERIQLLNLQADLQRDNRQLPPPAQRRLQELDYEVGLGRFEGLLREYEEERWRKTADPLRRQLEHANFYRGLVNEFVQLLGEARNERFERVRQTWPGLPPVCVHDVDLLEAELEEAQAVAAQAALINRLDL